MEYNPLTQVIISLIILLLMGYLAYNIYLIELQHMFKGSNDIRKETVISSGIFDYGSTTEKMFNTVNKASESYIDISPSINQEGGAEYSYNFWLYIDQERITKFKVNNMENKKDIVLFYKGEKNFYHNNDNNFNCSGLGNTVAGTAIWPTLITKNPLIRISHDGTKMAVDYNNILNPDSYQHASSYDNCGNLGSDGDKWENKNKNMLGVYDIKFNNKWFMVSVVMKEIADNNNILTQNRAMCKIYINGMVVYDNKVETKYGSKGDRYSATYKNNRSPFYMNPKFLSTHIKSDLNPYFNFSDGAIGGDGSSNILKIGDLAYYNYAINSDMINQLYNKGLTKKPVEEKLKANSRNFSMVSTYELENNLIKEL
jgi:hypothetical protein